MPSRESIEAYRKRQRALADAVEDALERFVRGLDLTRPEASRDALLEFVPALVDRFGPVAAEMAAEWYDELVEQAPGSRPFKATPVQANIAKEDIQTTTRRLAGGLWGDPLAELLPGLLASTGKWVQQSGRDTIVSNAKRERVRWARVPQGKKTCAFCLVLASRDAVYLSRHSASSKQDGSRYHPHCDCQAVRIASDEDYPKGYLPDDYYAMYSASAQAVGSTSDIKAIAADMRLRFPYAVKDAVPQGSKKRLGFVGTVKIPKGLKIEPHELNTGELLKNLGANVVFRGIDNTPGAKNPDIDMDGLTWEIKAPRGSSEKNTISDQFSRAGKQANNLVIDLARCGLDDTVALKQIERRFKGQNRIRRIIVFDHNGVVSYFP